MPGSSAPALGVGTLGAIGVLLALAARRRWGIGQLVEVPEQEALLSLLPFPTAMFAYLGHDHGRLGDRHPYGIYSGSDGHLGVSILTQGHWEALCRLMDRPDLADDPGLADGDLRARPDAVARIDAAITAWVADKAAQRTFEAGQAMGVPVTIIPSPRQVLGSAQYEARGFWHDHPDGVLGPLRLPGPPYPAGVGTFAPFRDAPRWGEDTAAVLDRLGVDADDRSALAALGVL
jgi:CoA:oxalate CoA-transferase